MYTNKSNKLIVSWLILNLFMIITMVFIGGITRLTDSGLSMIDWNLFKGILPPLSESDWKQAFDNYKLYPEFKLINYDIELGDFKRIFFWEYIHRIWGRLIGLTFILPLIYFFITNKLPIRTFKYLSFVLLIGCFQAFMGWYMVKSGLIDKPDVSQYRLASHLTIALIIYGLLLFLSWNLYRFGFIPNTRELTVKRTTLIQIIFCLLLVLTTIISGAFVAGTDSGLIYNNFPYMGNTILPPDPFILEPKWLNFFENKTLIQFDHRLLASATGLFIMYTCLKNFKLYKNTVIKRLLVILFFLIIFQYTIGILTLKLMVPISIGSLHQMGSVGVLSIIIVILSEFYGQKKGAII